MIPENARKAAAHYGPGEPELTVLGAGLIHRTYKVTFHDHSQVVLQCLNQHVFPQPENIIRNYTLLQSYLENRHPGSMAIPPLVKTKEGKFFQVDDEENFWRATTFMHNSFTPSDSKNEEEVFLAARAFGQFTKSLTGLDSSALDVVIPKFHDLSFRFEQFEHSLLNARSERLIKAKQVIDELTSRRSLVDFYEHVYTSSEFRRRVMHHDCKVSNILFDKDTRLPICPIDLDTTMPGYFFSDLGDMIRSMAPTEDEHSTDWNAIDVKKNLYEAILKGYTAGMEGELTTEENRHLHSAGLLLTYMQALRFLADYLNNDIYYQTTHPEENYDRAYNQLILLQKLEDMLNNEYGYILS